MKSLVCFVILLLVCVFTQVQSHTLLQEGGCDFDGETLSEGQHIRKCSRITCNNDGSISGVGCGTWACAPGTQIGYRDLDLNKPYPDCCAGPICK